MQTKIEPGPLFCNRNGAKRCEREREPRRIPTAIGGLLLHGDSDTRVKPRNSRKLAGLLQAAGSDVRLKLYPSLGHVGILTALAIPFRRQAPVLADVAAFAHEMSRNNDNR